MPEGSRRTFREGLAVGLIAYAAVALFYGVFDVLAARGPLYTVNVLGQAVFRGVRSPSVLELPIPLDMTAMLWYNAVHLVVSLAIGQVVLALVDLAVRYPNRSGFAFTIMLAGFVVTVVGIGVVTEPLRPVLPWWSIVVANALAVVISAAYVGSRRPGIWRALTAFARKSAVPPAAGIR
ncbi:MAG: hypothetical protein IT356_04480 [Gemmatimonadaceae bacterium]|nr:hypothetical protein [Gemmatimonadaceae bacterium]